jgi:hypothetical protein
MARLSPKSILAGASGAIGKEVVFKQYANRVVVSKMPDMSGIIPSNKQSARREIFQQAVHYAKSINRNPELKKAYAGKLKEGESVFNAALKEYLKMEKEKKP